MVYNSLPLFPTTSKLALVISKSDVCKNLGVLSLKFLKKLRKIWTFLCLDEYFKNNQSINYKTSISEKRPNQIILKIVFNQARGEAN